MGDHAQEMERTRVIRICLAGQAVEPLGLAETTGAMLRHRRRQRLFGTAAGVHEDISKGFTSVAGPIAPKAKVDLAGAAVDPDRLIARQRARRPVRRIACDVRGRMKNQRTSIIWWRQS